MSMFSTPLLSVTEELGHPLQAPRIGRVTTPVSLGHDETNRRAQVIA